MGLLSLLESATDWLSSLSRQSTGVKCLIWQCVYWRYEDGEHIVNIYLLTYNIRQRGQIIGGIFAFAKKNNSPAQKKLGPADRP